MSKPNRSPPVGLTRGHTGVGTHIGLGTLPERVTGEDAMAADWSTGRRLLLRPCRETPAEHRPCQQKDASWQLNPCMTRTGAVSRAFSLASCNISLACRVISADGATNAIEGMTCEE